MTLQEFYIWCEKTPIGVALQTNTYPFPVIEAVHLLTITLMLGTLFVINFRVLGFVLKDRPLTEVVAGITPWMRTGYVLTFLTGIVLFMSESLKLSANAAWLPKMGLLVGAMVFQFVLSAFILKGSRLEKPTGLAKTLAVVSTLLWVVTGMAARWIAFV